MATNAPLQFAPFSTSIAPDFWHSLTQLKLHVLKLSDEPVPIHATYSGGRNVKDRRTGQDVGLGATLELDGTSFDKAATGNQTSTRVTLPGILRNYNTIEDFKNADKTALLDQVADQIWSQTSSSASEKATGESLNPFLLITFADLKKYRYWYWCGFPALLQKPGWETLGEWSSVAAEELDQIQEYESSSSTNFFLAKPSGAANLSFGSLNSFASFFSDVPENNRTIVFTDPSSHASAPGWPLRNVLSYLSLSSESLSLSTIRVVALRDGEVAQTVTLRIKQDGAVVEKGENKKPAVVGWEKNEKGKLAPRMADLAPLMDPTRLADQAVDLNLQLMRWRIMPSLDLEKVSKTKVLLLGAGTLGCYVARTLMAWGVRKITLVDSSTVSFSNPVRQPLFEFEDSTNGGKPKAQAAAAALKRIYPGVDATGITLSIPMPGHPIAPALVDQAKADVKQLEDLIDQHDVVYLLMDSRESRWLPTVIGASKRKLVMNVALGFDTFLVMRHGVIDSAFGEEANSTEPDTVLPGEPYSGRLGCYYCNDIVAPMDSLTDRTLDQMCTVTRPGIASIASSTAVELMVSVLQHPKGSLAPSDIPPTSTSGSAQPEAPPAEPSLSSPLGIVPHQIRGFLAQFHNMKITGRAYDRCTGCSDLVVKAYEKDGFEMLVQAFADAKYLEQLTGLDKLYAESEALMDSVDWEEEEEESDDF